MNHDSYTVTTTPLVGHKLCGPITYTATFEGAIVDVKTIPPVGYDSDLRTFFMYSEDISLIGTRKVTVSAKLTNYSIIVTAAPESMQIEIIDSCISS